MTIICTMLAATAVTTREPVMPLVEGRTRYAAHEATYEWQDNQLRITMPKRICWISYANQPPGFPRMRGMDELVVMTEPAFEGGTINLNLNPEPIHDKRKPIERRKFTAPWKPETRFAIGAPATSAWYLASITFKLPEGRTNETFLLKGMDGIFTKTPAEAIRLDVDTGNPAHLINTPDGRATLTLENLAPRKTTLRGVLRVRDFFGAGPDIPVDRAIDAGETVRIPVPPLNGMGIWRVKGDITGDDGSRAFPKTRFAVLEPRSVTPPWPDGTFRPGIVYHVTRYSKIDREIAQSIMVAMGVKLVRCGLLSFARVCPQPGVYDWENDESLLRELEAGGFSVDAIIYKCPFWARPFDRQTKEASALPHPGDMASRPGLFRDFCEKLAARFGRRIAYYEIGNEWDTTDPNTLSVEDGIAMQREAYEGIHAGCPKAICIPNGWTAGEECDHRRFRKDFHRRMMTEARDSYDAHPIHLHYSIRNYAALIRGFLKFRQENGITKPWYSNESALSLIYKGGEDGVAVHVWQKMLFSWSHGSIDHVWYNLRATGFDPNDSEQGYGVVTGDFYPRASCAAFSAFVSVFGQLKFDALIDDTDDRLVGRWKGSRDGKEVIVLAGWDMSGDARPLDVSTDAKRALLCDIMGNRREVPIEGGAVVLPMTPIPAAVLLECATFAK